MVEGRGRDSSRFPLPRRRKRRGLVHGHEPRIGVHLDDGCLRLGFDRDRAAARFRGCRPVPRIAPFEAHPDRYEAWFARHQAAYLSELLALRAFLPWTGRGLEIGVGTGRFAAPLGVEVGIDPSPTMLALATARGVEVVEAVAEKLPFPSASFDYALVVTTICLVDSPARMLVEAHRVLKPGGRLVIGFIDRESPIGQDYLAHQAESVFYRDATFVSAEDVESLLLRNLFTIECWGQTLAHTLPETREIEPLQAGRGRCAFVVVAASKPRAEDRLQA